MTIAEVQANLLSNCWSLLRRNGLVRTFVENGSENVMTLAGEDDDEIPDLSLNDIRWTAGTL